MTDWRLIRVILVLCVAGLLGGVSASAEEPGGSGYVGAETCMTCHEEVGEELAETPHGKGGFASLSAHGCETCHGPGGLHVEDPTIVENQPVPRDVSASERNEICRSCHDGGAQFFWDNSAHSARGLACTDCHSVHSFASESGQLKEAQVMEQCFACHKDVRAETWKRSHHPIREGEMGCSDCHNPHGTSSEKMISAASINDQCYSCHTEKRGPFLWEHPPVRELCTTCHTPHGSNHLKLQRTSVPYICQQCHSNTRHPGSLYDRTRLADGLSPTNRDFSRACLNCHSAIHGSNHPSSPYLGH